jgi:hypothetical protein
MNEAIDMPIRLAVALYLKNTIACYWSEPDQSFTSTPFQIHEQDCALVRDSIVDAIVLAPTLIRSHLAVCLSVIIRTDFPARWTGVVDKVNAYLQTQDPNYWLGALTAIGQLVKHFEYKNMPERAPMDNAMAMLLPLLYQRCQHLLVSDGSDLSVLIQKETFKVFHAFMQYNFPMKVLTREVFTQWMELFRQAIARPVPTEQVDQLPIDERANTPHWKCKKWALHILARVFDRYGCPGSVSNKFASFAQWYTNTFSNGIIEVCLKILELQGNKLFVPPRVLQQTLNYLTTAMNLSFTWRVIKPHMPLIIQNILFPLMSYTEEDANLWETDPHEYIRLKFDVFEDYVSPVTAAQSLLHTCCKKRKGMLQKVLQFGITVLTDAAASNWMKDGALHMIGSVADLLFKSEQCYDPLENMLITYVYPFFQNPNGYLRARACWVLHYFSDVEFKNESHLIQGFQYVYHCFLNDAELPVKVEAAICLQHLINSSITVQKAAEQNIAQIILQLLKIIRETENEDLTNVMQKLVCLYPRQLQPIAYEMVLHLEQTFNQVLDNSNDEENDESALTALGVLNTIDTILTLMEDQTTIMTQLEPIVIRLVVKIFKNEVVDLYEEATTLVCTMTSLNVSQEMWQVFQLMYEVFRKDGFDYFTDMMPAWHNFMTVNPEGFVANESNNMALYEMCKTVLNSAGGEDAECHAAKLLECFILQFPGRIDVYIEPFIELALERLTKEVKTTELRTMCLQVIIAAFYYNEDLWLEIMQRRGSAPGRLHVINHFVQQWLTDCTSFLGLHDRRICMLGLLKMLALPPNKKPQVIYECTEKWLPTILTLFEGIQSARRAKQKSEFIETDSDGCDDLEESSSDDTDVVEDDADCVSDYPVPEGTDDNFANLLSKVNKQYPVTSATVEDESEGSFCSDDYDEEDDEFEPTALESYDTLIDSKYSYDDDYLTFVRSMDTIQTAEGEWLQRLCAVLTEAQKKQFNQLFLSGQCRQAALGKCIFLHFIPVHRLILFFLLSESIKIEKSGGYNFNTSQNVPQSFNFGGQ